MKTLIKVLLIAILIGLFACESDNSDLNTDTYLDYLSDKSILSIKIYNDTIWVSSSKYCDTCYVAPYMCYIPIIEQLTMIKDSYYEYDEPTIFETPNIDNQGNLYVASNNALYKLNAINNYSKILETGEFNFNSFAFDKNDNIWFTGDNGIAYWDKFDLTIYNSNNSELPSDITHGLAIDSSNIVWITLDFEGLLKINTSFWEVIPNSEIPGLNENSYLRNPIIDNKNNIWFTVFNPAVNSNVLVFNGTDWRYEYPNDDDFGRLNVDSEGTIWAIGNKYDNGNFSNSCLSYYKNGEWFDLDISSVSSQILTVNSNNNKVYIGTLNGLIEKSR